MPHAAADPDHLVTLLRRQRELYAALRALSEQQRSTLSGDRPERLLEILRERQDIVSSLSTLNEDLGPYRRNWDSTLGRLPESHRKVVGELHGEINGLLRVILKTDEEDAELLAVRKSAVSAQLAELGGRRAATVAYARTAGAAGFSAGALSADIRG